MWVCSIRHDPRFWAELRERLARYAGRPTPLYRAVRAVERMPALRPLNTAYDGHFGILTLAFGIGASEVAHVLATQSLWQSKSKSTVEAGAFA